MKVYIVFYVNSSYEDHIIDIFLTKEKAHNYIDTHTPEYDRANYFVTEYDVNE